MITIEEVIEECTIVDDSVLILTKNTLRALEKFMEMLPQAPDYIHIMSSCRVELEFEEVLYIAVDTTTNFNPQYTLTLDFDFENLQQQYTTEVPQIIIYDFPEALEKAKIINAKRKEKR